MTTAKKEITHTGPWSHDWSITAMHGRRDPGKTKVDIPILPGEAWSAGHQCSTKPSQTPALCQIPSHLGRQHNLAGVEAQGPDNEDNAPSLSISLSVQSGSGRGVPIHPPDDVRQAPLSSSAAKPPKRVSFYHFICQDALNCHPSTHTLGVLVQAGLYLLQYR